MALQVSRTWPMVGRDEVLEQIVRARVDADCRGIVVIAPPGMGKSRLAREAVKAAERDGAMCHWVQATSAAAAVPLGAVVGLVPDGTRTQDALEVMRRTAEAIRVSAEGRSVVLGVDDAQLLDPLSAALVLHLAQQESTFIIATLRSGEPCLDAVESLWKDAGAQRLWLEPLDADAVAMLVERAVGGPLEQATRQWIVGTSEGNALLVRELIAGAAESGALREDRGLWRLIREPSASPSLVDLVTRRLVGVSPEVRDAIELLAMGEPLRVAELVQLTTETAVADGESAGLLAIDAEAEPSEVRVAHPLYAEVVRAGLPDLRAQRVRRRLADAVRARGSLTGLEALRVSRWLLDANVAVPVDLLLVAGDAAVQISDGDLGENLAQLAIEAGADLSGRVLLARAHAVVHAYDRAADVLAGTEPFAVAAADDDAVDYLEQCVLILYWRLVREDEVAALLTRAQDWSREPSWQQRVASLQNQWEAMRAASVGTSSETERLLADPSLDGAVRHRIEFTQAVSLGFAGRIKEAWGLIWRARPAVPLGAPLDFLTLALCGLLGVESGEDWPAVEDYMTEILHGAVEVGDRGAAGVGAYNLGYLSYLQGRHREAERWLSEAELHMERYGPLGGELNVRALRVGIARATGSLVDPATARRDFRALLDASHLTPTQVPYVLRAEGWAAAEQSAGLGAEVLLDGARELRDQPLFSALLTYEAMRVGAPAQVAASELAALSGVCDARLVAAYGEHATASAAGDGDALLAASDQLAAIGARVYAMEAAVGAAEAFLRTGRGDSARQAGSRAFELHVGDQGAPLPVIDGLDGTAVELTEREAQVTALVGQGLTNSEIADRLVLSKRTVEAHVYRAMQKRGVSSRLQL